MLIIFRTDASLTIGTGHVIRCLTLAQALRKSGAQILFISREHEGHLCEHIEEQCFAVYRLPSPSTDYVSEDAPAHAAWLGAPWQEDAAATAAAITSLQIKPDWLIIDHYGIDQRWEDLLRPLVNKIMVIDDLADRHHDCDLFLDQNLVPNMESRYNDLLPEGCTRLLGPEYALLQPIYAELHERIPPREGPVRRILISFGGADSDNLTGWAIEAFISLNRPDIEVDVVIADTSPHNPSLQKLAQGHPNIHLHGTLPTLAPLMAKADLAIGAAGATSWERLCLGLPSIVVTLAENQVSIAQGLQDRGLIRWLGHKDIITKEIIQDCLNNLIKHGIDASWSQRCHQAVDGKGVDRTQAVLTMTPETPLHARHATLSDEALLLAWANDPETRKNSFSPDFISPATHRQWFYCRLRDIEGCLIYILETESGVPVGQVRFEREEQVWELHYAVAPEFRGKGIGKSLLNAALQKFREDYSGVLILGKVKAENIRSQRVFEGLGFKRKPDGGGWRISVCSDSGSWMNAFIPDLMINWICEGHEVRWTHDASELPEGDICFYLSYGKIVKGTLFSRHSNNLVVHASDLPRGRGWSPMTWRIIEGDNEIPVTLFEAAESVDSGPTYKQVILSFSGIELLKEMQHALGRAVNDLCRYFVHEFPDVIHSANPQSGEATYYPRRHPEDSQIDINCPFKSQFNLLRTVDNEKYPAWFEYQGRRYILHIISQDDLLLNN